MINRRFAALALSTLFLTACGFTPVHAPRTASGDMALKDVRIQVIETGSLINDEAGFFLNQRLRDRLGINGQRHTLEVTPKIRRSGLGVSGEDVASRYDLAMSAKYVLRDTKTGDTLTKGTVRSTSTFGAPRDPYGRDAAENNAARQVAAETADRLLLKLASYYADPDT